MNKLDTRQQKTKDYKNRKILKPSGKYDSAKANPSLKRRQPIASDASDLERSFQASRATALVTGKPEEVALRRITAAVRASLEVGPTLVVWVIDRTPSASKTVTDGTAAAKAMYDVPEIRQATIGSDQNLLTAVVMFDEQVEFTLDPPVADWQKAKDAFDQVKLAEGGKEMTFTAIQQAVEKYLPLRTKDRREVIFVVFTDEAGDDADKVDTVTDIFKKNAIPVYVIGSPAPWGQTNPYVAAGAKPAGPNDDTYPTHGPESIMSERVNIQMWGNQYGAREDLSMIDSGFGPFALERLCRVSGGEFIPIRPAVGSIYQYRGTAIGHKFWPTGSELRFDPKVVGKYAPDYVSQADFQQMLAKNRARQALVDAAKLAPISIDAFPSQRFEKKNEAQMARQLNTAQQFAARHSPEVDQLFNILSNGEGDRDKLTSLRLQAEFDLAMGRTLAAKVRLDGYNAMLAALKRGKNFENPSSREWLLEQGIKIETGSVIQKMSEKAIMYLQRVKDEHPGTPWAKLAEHELNIPLGWEWKEG
ncbi:vWA domain-containing protein [Anatilimnocola aggregata]|nr:vWA domain-containing protein [Anatilimnocola aggregata]